MEEKFEDLLSQILEDYDKNKNVDIDEYIRNKAKELGLSEDNLKLLAETDATIEKFDKSNKELQEYKEDTGKSRASWFTKKLNTILTKFGMNDEQKEQSIKNISDSITAVTYSQYESAGLIKEDQLKMEDK